MGILGCGVGNWPLAYLGANLGCSSKKHKFWIPVVKKVRAQLTNWKCTSLNKAGRATLITTTLNSIPTYWFQLFRAPKMVINQLDRISRDFYRNENPTAEVHKRRLHNIGWNKLILPKDLGGLGMMNLDLKNLTLLSKWKWKLMHDRKNLWNKIVVGKYGRGGTILNGRESSVDFRKLSEIMQSIKRTSTDSHNGSFLTNNFHWKIKDGSLVDFWKDSWHSTGILEVQFNDLFILVREKCCTLKEMKQDWSKGQSNELVLWSRSLTTQEHNEVSRLGVIIETTSLINGEDILSWGPLVGQFKSSLCYRDLLKDRGLVGPWKLIWKLKIPSRIKLFLWQLAHGCLSTLSFLYSKTSWTMPLVNGAEKMMRT